MNDKDTKLFDLAIITDSTLVVVKWNKKSGKIDELHSLRYDICSVERVGSISLVQTIVGSGIYKFWVKKFSFEFIVDMNVIREEVSE